MVPMLMIAACSETTAQGGEPGAGQHDAGDEHPGDAAAPDTGDAGTSNMERDGGSDPTTTLCPSGERPFTVIYYPYEEPLQATFTAVEVEVTPDQLTLFVVEGDADLDAGSEDAIELGIGRMGVGFPADLIQVGDTLEISFTMEENFVQRFQSLIVTRAGELVLFWGVRRVERIDQPNLWSELALFDIEITTAPEACRLPRALSCELVEHDLRVTRGGESAVRSATGTLQVGALTVAGALVESLDLSVCEAARLGLHVLGFVSP
jgi:hypothetical protein